MMLSWRVRRPLAWAITSGGGWPAGVPIPLGKQERIPGRWQVGLPAAESVDLASLAKCLPPANALYSGNVGRVQGAGQGLAELAEALDDSRTSGALH